MRSLLLTGLAALLLLIAATFFGVVDLPPTEIAAALFGRGADEADLIITTLRVPRILTGILAGMHFAVAGVLLQAVTRIRLPTPPSSASRKARRSRSQPSSS